MTTRRSPVALLLAALLFGGLVITPGGVRAADPAFVGVLALAVEQDVAQKLGLSDETRQKLLDLIDEREAQVGSLALEIKDLPPEAQAERLAPFVAESERQGLMLLTALQRETLREIRLARAGLETLAEADVAQVLGLTAEQQTQVKQLLAQREQALTAGGEDQRQATRGDYERRLLDVLSRSQRANWERLAGLAEGPVQVAQADPAATKPSAGEPSDEPTPDQPAPDSNNPPAPDSSNPPAEKSPSDQPPPVAENTPPASDPESTTPEPPETAPSEAGQPANQQPSEPQPAEQQPAEPRQLKDLDEVKVRFSWNYTPWKDVLEWLAEQADLSLLMDVVPPGTFNYTDPRTYSLEEAMDLINSVLLTKDFTLVRRDRMLMVLNLEDGVPEELVEFVPLSELDERGEFEIVKTLFQLVKMDPADAEAEIAPLLGPGRSMVVMPKSRQLLVTETAGNLRVIRSIVDRIENPGQKDEAVTEIKLDHVTAEDILQVARPLLGLGEEENVNDEIQIALDTLGTRLFVTGTEEKLKRLKDLVPMIDRESPLAPGRAAVEQPQLETYAIQSADPEQVLAVLQTLLAGLPDTRLAIDPVSGKLIALARPSDHKTIVATLRQLEGQADQLEVIQLRSLDPQLVVLTINKLYPVEGGEEGQSALKVDGDPTTGKLWVRGPREQIDQVKQLVEKLEGADGLTGADRGNVRLLPFTGNEARAALENLETLWPAIRPNRIRVVTPSNTIRAMQGLQRFPGRGQDAGSGDAGERFEREGFERDGFERPDGRPAVPPAARPAVPPAARPAVPPEARPASPPPDRATRRNHAKGIRYVFTAHRQPASEDGSAAEDASAEPAVPEATDGGLSTTTQPAASDVAPGTQPAPAAPAEDETPRPASPPQPGTAPRAPGSPPAEIIVSITPQGLVIASEDTAALDEFESLLRTLSGGVGVETVEPTVFWLKYAKADAARQLLEQILGGGGGDSGGGGSSLLGDMANNMLGGVGGGLLGGLLGGAGGDGGGGVLQATGSVSIVADNRLNALIVQANAVDLRLIEQLLQVIDQESSPEDVQTYGKPRIIPVRYVSVEEVANVVKQVYAARLQSGDSGGGGRRQQPDPAEFIRALRGGGGRQGNQRGGGEEQKMTIGVDTRTNSLIVSAPDPLFEEVRTLVELIDIQDAANSEDVQVVTIPGANPDAVKAALDAVLGQPVASSSGGSSNRGEAASGGGGDNNGGPTPEQLQQRAEFFRRLRESGGFGRGPSSGGSRGGFGGRGGSPFGGGRGGSPFGGRGGGRGGR